MEVEVGLEDMKLALREASLFEEGMSSKEINEYYKVISLSKDAASSDVVSRRLNKSRQELMDALEDDPEINSEAEFAPKMWNSEKTVISTSTKNEPSKIIDDDDLDDFDFTLKKIPSEETSELTNESDPLQENPFMDAKKSIFGFNEMPESTKNTLRFIPQKLAFIPIHLTKEFLKASIHEKAKMLYIYHTKMNNRRAQASRKSFFPAPMPAPICLHEQNSIANQESKETYVSRSGRQTKRKVYYENEDSLDDLTTSKKTKNTELEWHGKKVDKAKIEPKKLSKIQENDSSVLGPAVDDENSTNKVVDECPKQPSGQSRSKKLTNFEIMKKSSLFADSPPRLTRNEMIFDKLKEEEVKRRKQEKSMELFEQTIERVDDEKNHDSDEDDKSEIISVDDEESFPRRVIPPGRKPIRRKNKIIEPSPLDVKISAKARNGTPRNTPSPTFSLEPTVTPIPKTLKKRPNLSKSQSAIQIVNEASTSIDKNVSLTSGTVECPMCGQYFTERKIEEHAWTCSNEPLTTRSSQRIPRSVSKITCEVCDKVVPLEISYDVHVRECREKEQESQSS